MCVTGTIAYHARRPRRTVDGLGYDPRRPGPAASSASTAMSALAPRHTGARAHRSMNSGTYSRMLNERSDPLQRGHENGEHRGLGRPPRAKRSTSRATAMFHACRQVAAAGLVCARKLTQQRVSVGVGRSSLRTAGRRSALEAVHRESAHLVGVQVRDRTSRRSDLRR